MLFGVKKQALLVLHERASRLTLLQRPENKGAEAVARAMLAVMGTLPMEMRRSVTFDNGTEFARHHELHELGVEAFFCDVRSPWRKGEWRTRSGVCGGSCRGGRTWTACRTRS